ncbi:redox-sensitive transcriptional activator SoxR [Streptomyces sp. NPDC051742]|uniref:redox-sensitive transcriptional activator SoxR n=1 Tax=Streptomyces sp. NPDC051742 TaxID=3155169 RepID=UPI003415E3F1
MRTGSPARPAHLTIGELAARSRVPTSTLRFYERRGLITSERTLGNQRRYPRDVLRRVTFIRMSQQLGIPLAEVRAVLGLLPEGRTPTAEDWARISRCWRKDLDARLGRLTELRDRLEECIGCGCMSFSGCLLANPDGVRPGPAGPDRPGTDRADPAGADPADPGGA